MITHSRLVRSSTEKKEQHEKFRHIPLSKMNNSIGINSKECYLENFLGKKCRGIIRSMPKQLKKDKSIFKNENKSNEWKGEWL